MRGEVQGDDFCRHFFFSLFSLFDGFMQTLPTAYIIIGHSLSGNVSEPLKFCPCDA